MFKLRVFVQIMRPSVCRDCGRTLPSDRNCLTCEQDREYAASLLRDQQRQVVNTVSVQSASSDNEMPVADLQQVNQQGAYANC